MASIEKKCIVCSKKFNTPTHAPHKQVCSYECAGERKNIKKSSLDRYIIFSRDSFRCSYCGRNSIEHKIVLCIDHIVPKSKNGKNIASNLITSCLGCNDSKATRGFNDIAAKTLNKEIKRRNADNNIDGDLVINLKVI